MEEDTQIQHYEELINGINDGMSTSFYLKTTSMKLKITKEQAYRVLQKYIDSREMRLDNGDDGCEHELWVQPSVYGKLILVLADTMDCDGL